MKHRIVIATALSIVALTASAAAASTTSPDGGTWKGKAGNDESVRFTVEKSTSGAVKASAASAQVTAGCKAPNPKDSTTARVIKVRGATVKLTASGKDLKGSQTVKRTVSGGKATQTVKISLTFTSARRAKAVVSGRYATKVSNPRSNADDCSGRIALTAKPK